MPAPVLAQAACVAGDGDLGGTIWRDFNSDGTQDAGDVSFQNVTVTAYDNDGNAVAAPVAADGTYNFSGIFSNETHIRLEFSGLPDWAESSFAGVNNGTTVQIHDSATCEADLGIQHPAEYCQNAPMVGLTCFPLNGGSDGNNSAFLTIASAAASGSDASLKSPDVAELAVGATWGVGYDRINHDAYIGAVLKRHSEFGPLGPGGLYKVEYDASGNVQQVVQWATVPNAGTIGIRDLPVNNPGFHSRDTEAYSLSAKIGLGDINVTYDGSTLYAMNLNDNGSLVEYDTATATINNTYPVDDPGCAAATDVRPWAVHVNYTTDAVYIGVVCSEESTQTHADMVAYVMELTPGSGLGNFTTVTSIPLDYVKAPVAPSYSDCTHTDKWHAWDSDPTHFGSRSNPDQYCQTVNYGSEQDTLGYPTPILADIEIDTDGSLILGFADRFALQSAQGNYGPDEATTGSKLFASNAGGDILRMCSVNGAFVLEGNAGCPFNGTTEYYVGDDFLVGTNPAHAETALGGLALLASADEVLAVVYDPIDDVNSNYDQFATGGIVTLDNTTGEKENSYRVVDASQAFGKTGSLGDIELFCELAPIQIGNYVWLDEDEDGIQDPCEPALPNVAVVLTAADGTTTATATDANGEYYFAVEPNSPYTVTIDTTQAALATYVLTVADANSGTTLSDGVDSDATSSGDLAVITLTTGDVGQNDHTLDFGFIPRGSIGDRVWYDADGSGTREAGEPGIENVVVILTDSSGNTFTTTTDSTGTYLFEDLPLGDYTVMVETSTLPASKLSLPSGDPDGGADSTSQITLSADDPATPEDEANNRDQDFGYEPFGSIGDRVWHDADGSGTREVDEPGIENIVVILTDSSGNTFTTTTDSTGTYLFDNLPLGEYTVMVDTSTLPASKLSLPTYDPDGGADSTSMVTLAVDDPATPLDEANNRDQDFGYEPFGSIGNRIFHDLNGDGIFDMNDGEFPIGGVTLLLTDSSGNTMTTTTDSDGQYLFDNLPLGDYTIMVDTSTLPASKLSLPTYDPDGVADSISMVTLAVDDPATPEDEANNRDQDFGYEPILGRIGDTIWHDADGDGVQDPDEAGILNVMVTLIDANGNTLMTTTDTNGMYIFDGLPLGDYTVVVDTSSLPTGKVTDATGDPDGGADSTSAVSLTPAAPENLDQDFGYEPLLGSIGDQIWHDDDNDGNSVVDGDDEPLANVTVNLLDVDGNIMGSTQTDANGFYLFSDLPLDATYTVQIDPLTLPVGKQGNSAFDPESDGDNLSTVTLTFDDPTTPQDEENDRDRDFAYFIPDVPLGSIGDQIWHDNDNDGNDVIDGDDAPIAGVTVNLLDTNGNILATTQTDANGLYLFTDLPLDATYTVQIDPLTLPVGKQGNSAFDPESDGDNLSTVTLTFDDPTTPQDEENDRDRDFAYFIPDVPLGSIGDQIWHDDDNDGNDVIDGDDAPIAGVTVNLLDANGNILATTQTDANGLYLFTDLPLDTAYSVQVDTSTLPAAKQGNPAYDVDGGDDNMSTITLTADDPNTSQDEANDRNQDFAYFTSSAILGSIGDTIFHDANRDSMLNTADGDFALPSVTVSLLDSSGSVIATTKTDVNGTYLFEQLPMGDYTVQVDTTTLPDGKQTVPTADPDGGADSISEVRLTASAPNDRDQDFGYGQDPTLASLGNYYWVDDDKDGIFDPEEAPVVGMLVTLFDNDGAIADQVETDENGYFVFTVEPGDYYLDFTLPDGYVFTLQDSTGGYDSDVDPRTGQTVGITLEGGTHDPSWGAGVVLVGAPTAVNLSSFTAELRTGESGTEIVVRWSTSAEMDTFGFHVLRSRDGTLAGARQVTNHMTLRQGSSGGTYEVVLPYDAATDPLLSELLFWLYEVEIDGSIHHYGPATAKAGAANANGSMYLPFITQ